MRPAAAQPRLASWLHQLQGHAVGQHISPLSLGLLNRKRRINLHQLKAYGEGQIHVRHVLQRGVCHYFYGEKSKPGTPDLGRTWSLRPVHTKSARVLHLLLKGEGPRTVIPRYPWGIGPKTLTDIEIHRCSSPLYEMGSASADTEAPLCFPK